MKKLRFTLLISAAAVAALFIAVKLLGMDWVFLWARPVGFSLVAALLIAWGILSVFYVKRKIMKIALMSFCFILVMAALTRIWFFTSENIFFERFLVSPSKEHRVIVTHFCGGHCAYSANSVKALVFIEKAQTVSWGGPCDSTYVWLDENTLEISTDYQDESGEPYTKRINF